MEDFFSSLHPLSSSRYHFSIITVRLLKRSVEALSGVMQKDPDTPRLVLMALVVPPSVPFRRSTSTQIMCNAGLRPNSCTRARL